MRKFTCIECSGSKKVNLERFILKNSRGIFIFVEMPLLDQLSAITSHHPYLGFLQYLYKQKILICDTYVQL